MTDQALVFSRSGRQLAELPVAITRAWKSQRTIEAARGSYTLSANDPKALLYILQYGNIVFVQSDSGVQNWAGIIWPPMKIKNGVIEVQIKSIEFAMGTRLTPATLELDDSPALGFKRLLQSFAAKPLDYPVDVDNPVISSTAFGWKKVGVTLHYANIYEELNKLANNSLNYWWLEPVYESGYIKFIPHLEGKIGRKFPARLVENLNFNDVEIKEINDKFANVLTGVCDTGETNYGIVTASAENQASIGRYGRIEGYVALSDMTEVEAVQAAVDALLPERAFPLLQLTGSVTARPFPRAGDTVTVELSTAGSFLSTQRGGLLDCLVVSASYSPESDEMFIIAQEIPEGMEPNA